MPVYLCQSGLQQGQPWRFGIQVYAAPFPIEESATSSNVATSPANNETAPNPRASGGRDLVVATWMPGNSRTNNEGGSTEQNQQQSSASTRSSALLVGHAIRRVRHAEIVLVDDVCIAHDRYWLRLRWPGHKGGFAGYIAMGLVNEQQKISGASNEFLMDVQSPVTRGTSADEDGEPASADDDPNRDEEPAETSSMPPSEPPSEKSDPTISLTCLRTGLPFPTSTAMQLMAVYDDGVIPSVASTPFPPEPVFCRICREGLHDDADEEQPGAEEDAGEEGPQDPSSHTLGESDDNDFEGDYAREGSGGGSGYASGGPTNVKIRSRGPIQPHPTYHANAEALQNPFLAPCECSGSMAFVHYLCVEQWRCRSRHPEAHHGLHCETCGTAYSLPPPSERPAPQTHTFDQEDWIDAMPPHVMQALRQPHIGWQIGAAIVRRRWLRPLAPVIVSPIVALYCRARRLLKKRGVARRRWACSLCRRRARWKCVRCLRSYYCSRQCQNVSWHIVHKHVCYKPARFWWSVIVYGAAAVAMCPGMLRDPIMYDVGMLFVPISFVVMGILGGGLALLMKKTAGVDLRGRALEFSVVMCTLYLSYITWGLVRGFFGDSSACVGAFGGFKVHAEDLDRWPVLSMMRHFFFSPAKKYYLLWDKLPSKIDIGWLESALCTDNGEPGCFEHLPKANTDFFLAESGGAKCAADISGLCWLYGFAAFTLVGSSAWKQHDRNRRRHARRPGRGEPRPHQD